MNYLIPTFDCVLVNQGCFKLTANAKYKIENTENEYAVVYSNSRIEPFVLDLNFEENDLINKNLIKVKSGFDNYYFLFPTYNANCFVASFKYKSKQVFITLSCKLSISIEGKVVVNDNVCEINYSHFEVFNDFCLIYFSGTRNYLAVLKDEEVLFSNYYDECNVENNQKYFMRKLNDSLNHGEVCSVNEKEVSTYLVYLDDAELKLKREFVAHVFLDCIKAKNYKYCNELLSEDLKLEHVEDVKKFFPAFDYFYPLSENEFVLIEKNTLAGIYKFDIEKCDLNFKISNITSR